MSVEAAKIIAFFGAVGFSIWMLVRRTEASGSDGGDSGSDGSTDPDSGSSDGGGDGGGGGD